jgi:beta-galactosidase
MRKIFFPVVITLISFILLIGCNKNGNQLSRLKNFDAGWLFLNDSLTSAEAAGFNDAGWKKIDLPHDWSIDDLPGQSDSVIGPFSTKSPGGMSTGYFLGGTGWYRKHFSISQDETNKLIWINFDGVYMDCDVWLNGQHIGNHPYGYTPFNFEISRYLKKSGEDNVLAVRVRNAGQNSRWYSGSGIYRHVELIETDSVHIIPWGVYITTSRPSAETATALVVTTVENSTHNDVAVKLTTRIFDKNNSLVGTADTLQTIGKGITIPLNMTVEIKNPALWSPDHPELYRAEVGLTYNGSIKDLVHENFGIRTIEVSADHGLLINGKNVLLKGGCMHHDNGLLGSATIDRAEERRVELMKANGFNAIRTSHNPPSRQFLDACDRLGMIVIDEAFDMWERPKNPQDYSRFFDDWWDKDVTSMIMRDRNHPSVVFWSIGNEINERADTSGLIIGKKLVDLMHRLDPTRPVTEAICEFWENRGRPWDDTAPAFALLDVGGYNYQWRRYEADHEKYPSRIMMGTESIAIEALQNWNMVEKHSYVIGDFVWTAMDYMGETAIGHSVLDNEFNDFRLPWPWFNSWCGDIDIIGNKKPQLYFRDVVWNNSKIEMLVHTPLPAGRKEVVSYWGWPDEWPDWNWKGHEGEKMKVRVFTRCTSVRLELNGKVIAEQPVPDSSLTAVFEVPYEAGTLKATGLMNGNEECTKILATTGQPAAVKLLPDRSAINDSRDDLSYVRVAIVDDAGNVVPDAGIDVNFSITGPAEIAAAGSACPDCLNSFTKPECKTFKGYGLVIVRPTGGKGSVELKAESQGLKNIPVTIQVE